VLDAEQAIEIALVLDLTALELALGNGPQGHARVLQALHQLTIRDERTRGRPVRVGLVVHLSPLLGLEQPAPRADEADAVRGGERLQGLQAAQATQAAGLVREMLGVDRVLVRSDEDGESCAAGLGPSLELGDGADPGLRFARRERIQAAVHRERTILGSEQPAVRAANAIRAVFDVQGTPQPQIEEDERLSKADVVIHPVVQAGGEVPPIFEGGPGRRRRCQCPPFELARRAVASPERLHQQRCREQHEEQSAGQAGAKSRCGSRHGVRTGSR